jgi:hypothetical protein
MVLSDEDILSFQAIYRKRFGREISKEDAYEKGIKLLQLMSIVYQPMTEAEYQNLQVRRQETKTLHANKS